MADINPTLPSVGALNSVADPQVRTALQEIVATINALETANLADLAVTDAKIAAATITDAKIAADAWTAFTPTVTGTSLTLGTGGTNVGRYVKRGRVVHAYGVVTIGTGGAFVGSSIRLALPFTADSDANQIGNTYVYDASTGGYFPGHCQIDAGSPTVLGFRFMSSVGGVPNPVAATTPITWAVGDELIWNITYESAA